MYSRFAILSCLLITVLRQKHVCAVSIGKKEVLTLATVTDIHIGENCHGDLTFNGCKPIRALTDAINKINSMADIDGVFVTGDLTASALYEEFSKAREILDSLTVPWWPLLGNHDVWPYNNHVDGTFNQTDAPIGDKYFAEVFGDKVNGAKVTDTSSYTISGWPTSPCLNGDNKTYDSWFHNFVVSFPQFSEHFSILVMDWNARSAALPYPGVGPEAELHDFPGGTMDWLRNTLSDIQKQSAAKKEQNAGAAEASQTFFIMQHHPFHNRDSLDPLGHNVVFNFTFDNNQDKSVEQVLSNYFPTTAYLGSAAGHNHRWFNGSAFTRFTALNEDWMQMPAFETPACKGWWLNEDYVSSVQFFRFSKAPVTSQVQLSNVFGLWKTPAGDWERKPV